MRQFHLLFLCCLLHVQSFALGKWETTVIFLDADTKDTVNGISITMGDCIDFSLTGKIYSLSWKKAMKYPIIFSCSGFNPAAYDKEILPFYSGDTLVIQLIPSLPNMTERWKQGHLYNDFSAATTVSLKNSEELRNWIADTLRFGDPITEQYIYHCGNDSRTCLAIHLNKEEKNTYRISSIDVQHDHYHGYLESYLSLLLPHLPAFTLEAEEENSTAIHLAVYPKHL